MPCGRLGSRALKTWRPRRLPAPWARFENHYTTAGAFRLAKVALRVLQEKGALNLSPEALAREVVDVVYEQAPLESRAMAFRACLK